MLFDIKGLFEDDYIKEDDYWLGVLTSHKRIHHTQAIKAFFTYISTAYGSEGI